MFWLSAQKQEVQSVLNIAKGPTHISPCLQFPANDKKDYSPVVEVMDMEGVGRVEVGLGEDREVGDMGVGDLGEGMGEDLKQQTQMHTHTASSF